MNASTATKEPKRVGKPYGNKNFPKKPLSYNQLPTDDEGFVDAHKYLPIDYDLVQVKAGDRLISAWRAGRKWDGLHLTPNTPIRWWKRTGYQFEITDRIEE